MRIPRIYTAQPLCVGSDAELDEIATHHIAKVLRMQVGQFLELFNGDQQNYQATITAIHKKRMVVTVTHNSPGVPASRLQTHIGQVVSKGDRMDYMVQKATELGVNIITPLFSERCDVRLNKEREEKRIRHWQQIAINASEQCGRTDVPEIRPGRTLDAWCQDATEAVRLVMYHHQNETLSTIFAADKNPESATVLVGPEGGLTEEEVAIAMNHQFKPVKLGNRVFRTETAPVAALTLLQWHWGDFAL